MNSGIKLIIYAVNNKVGGGKSVLENLLTCLHRRNSQLGSLLVFCPYANLNEYQKRYNGINFISYWPLKYPFFTLVFAVFFPILYRRYGVTVLNLADIPMPFQMINQIYQFDWPYGVDVDPRIWHRMTLRENILRRIKLFVFKQFIKYPQLVLAQTRDMASRLRNQYVINNIKIFPNGFDSKGLHFDSKKYDYLRKIEGVHLLMFSAFYTHKNFEVLPSVLYMYGLIANAEKINIIITLPYETALNQTIFDRLNNVTNGKVSIINVGAVQSLDIMSLYNNTDALFLPTLLESFSGTYLESAFFKKPILTSNLPFAIEILGDSAYYFDPYSPQSICNSILRFVADHRKGSIMLPEVQLEDFSWDRNLERLMVEIDALT